MLPFHNISTYWLNLPRTQWNGAQLKMKGFAGFSWVSKFHCFHPCETKTLPESQPWEGVHLLAFFLISDKGQLLMIVDYYVNSPLQIYIICWADINSPGEEGAVEPRQWFHKYLHNLSSTCPPSISYLIKLYLWIFKNSVLNDVYVLDQMCIQ